MLMEFLYLVIAFFATFFIFQIVHEFIHKYLAERNGAKAKIQVWFWHHIPSMACVVTEGNPGKPLFDMAGIFTGFILMILTLICYPFWLLGYIVFFTNMLIQILYGCYETLFINIWPMDKYMKYHYYVYLIVIICSVVVLFDKILIYLGV